MANGKVIPGVILAAGGVVHRNGRVIVILNHRGEWTLPRGKLKKGESPLEAALREVHEETGYAVRSEGFLDTVSYLVNDVPKVVLYWTMSALGEQGRIDASEIREVRWITPAQAARLLTHEAERGLVQRLVSEQVEAGR